MSTFAVNSQNTKTKIDKTKTVQRDIKKNIKSNKPSNVFDEMSQWQLGHQGNVEELLGKYETAKGLIDEADEILDKMNRTQLSEEKYEEYMKVLDEAGALADKIVAQGEKEYAQYRKEAGVDFSFMQGKDSNNKKDYQSQLHELAKGEIKAKDTNNDGKISFDEFLAFETKDLPEDVDVEEITAQARKLFDKMNEEHDGVLDKTLANLFGANYNNPLREDELASFYEYMDTVGGDDYGNTFKAPKDGKINVDGYVNWIGEVIEE